jgi:RNA polymerase sigma factor (sigma-70 family)
VDSATFDKWSLDDVHLIRITGVLDFPAAVQLRLALYGCVDADAAGVVVDLSRVTLLDASSISVLLAVRDRLRTRGGALLVTGAGGLVLRALEITGAAKTLTVDVPPDQSSPDPADMAADRVTLEVEGWWEMRPTSWSARSPTAADGYRPTSLDAPVGTDSDAFTLLDRLGNDEAGYDAVVHHPALRGLLATLPEREQAIISMRFYGDMSQREIAERIGISQMHVSRLLTQILTRFRRALTTGWTKRRLIRRRRGPPTAARRALWRRWG